MPEFRIEGDALKREARFRRLSWSTVIALTAVVVFFIALRCFGLKFNPGLIGLLIFSFSGAFFGACILACREAMISAERQMVFVLDDNGITRKRQGYPPVHIPFSEIEYIGEELRWLIVKSSDRQKKIGIPKSVNGYELICAELSKHHPFSPPTDFPLARFALLPVSILSWAAVVWFRDLRIVIPAGIIAMLLLAFGSYRLWITYNLRRKKLLIPVCLGIVWLLAFLAIYVLHAMEP